MPAQENLKASKLRKLTGLSDRQLHEWDKRGALPHARTGRGQRRVNVWQAMALKIAAAIRDRFDIPLTKLRPVVQWMLGNDPSQIDVVMAMTANAPLLPETQAQADFAKELLAQRAPRGTEVLDEVPELLSRAASLGHPGATTAVHRLAAALVPVYRALGEVSTGFPVFLLSNLDSNQFVGEPLLLDYVRAGVLYRDCLVVRVDEHINAVLEATGSRTFPVSQRASDLQEIEGERLEEKERTVLRLLRTREFDRIMIEPKGGGYRIEATREVPEAEVAKLEELIRSHDYQSVLVKKRRGKIVRLSQTVSILTSDPVDGKIPPRAEPKGASDE